MKLTAQILITILSVVFVMFGAGLDSLGGLDGENRPTLWKTCKIIAGAVIIALAWWRMG